MSLYACAFVFCFGETPDADDKQQKCGVTTFAYSDEGCGRDLD